MSSKDKKKEKEKVRKPSGRINKVKEKEVKKEPVHSKTGLLSAGDIGKLAGVPSNTVHHWKARYSDFPKPVDSPTAGDLYRRGAVLAWLRKTNRLK